MCKNIISVENTKSETMSQDTNKAKFTINSDQNKWENHSKHENENCVNSQIWCVDCNENVVVLGCADGSLQFWDLYKGILKVCHCMFIVLIVKKKFYFQIIISVCGKETLMMDLQRLN